MQAVILAAGKGTRMYPLAVDKPKPLIEVANKPVLEHNLEQMLGLVEEVVIIVGYKKDMIINRFGNNYKGIKITYVVQEEQLGTGHAVLMAKEFVNEKFLVLNGDDLFSRKDMGNISKYENCILIKYKRDASAFGAVVIENGKVKDIVEKSKEFVSNYVNAGMYCFSPEVFAILQGLEPSIRGEYELTDAVKVLAKQGKMHAEEVKGYWIPVGYPWHVLDATEKLLNEKDEISIKGKLGKDVIIEGSVDIGEGSIIEDGCVLKGNIVIGRGCLIGENCILEGFTAIGDGSRIGDNVKLKNTIVGAGCDLEEGCEVSDSVLGDKARLSAGVKVSNAGKDKTVKVNGNGKEHDSGKEKLGAFVKDKCEVGKKLDAGECVDKDC
ncbi:NTP transferase domain-containing protein [Candidatus Woesearchaeota archaeon]|jgi:UDP-N-acetylglucosamine diphosphorylase / glucose-1-phosphate thymidylyltransferase / UDP-N-acetylgalactosamine diphosphorylase / glucosamine-1-phosphate N-acetyltransferase / galactosamine-1-phosphate N-acetyltransferase|nr:NTP transferase domain-containing protein [Candidatus Woesearchaeota archaeon]MBT4110607.1 NTP transferase domain-containing protein [Candidatus Woesearchaeota archaeon]MBT4335869.1 NTP transferase domain-containing protein [Candidatus Woesearchaeota archaeon]MBT4469152.1 NTP transferase domain-containing protein [Candidatus Woesearchaeota archaeon]MBT6744529.1 NTP transferase domain-containing protein [Candidatus Woesearchaeota archaeon]